MLFAEPSPGRASSCQELSICWTSEVEGVSRPGSPVPEGVFIPSYLFLLRGEEGSGPKKTAMKKNVER